MVEPCDGLDDICLLVHDDDGGSAQAGLSGDQSIKVHQDFVANTEIEMNLYNDVANNSEIEINLYNDVANNTEIEIN
jgi:hypothetical protein